MMGVAGAFIYAKSAFLKILATKPLKEWQKVTI